MIRMYGRELARRALLDGAEFFGMAAGLCLCGYDAFFGYVLWGYLMSRGLTRYAESRRLRAKIAYVDSTVVSTANQPLERRRPPPARRYVN